MLYWMDNIKTWTGLSVEESIRMTEDRDKWRKYVHGVANTRIEDGYRTEHNRTEQSLKYFYYSVRCAYVTEAKKESTTEPKAPFWATQITST